MVRIKREGGAAGGAARGALLYYGDA